MIDFPAMYLRVAMIVATLAACSGGKKSTQQPADPAGSANNDVPPALVSVADCTALISHALKLRVAELGSGAKMTEAEEKQLRDQVSAAVDTDCHKLTPAQLKCGMAATTLDAYTACDQAKQSTGSGSAAGSASGSGAGSGSAHAQ